MLAWFQLSLTFLIGALLTGPAFKELRLQSEAARGDLTSRKEETLASLTFSVPILLATATFLVTLEIVRFLVLPMGSELANSLRFVLMVTLSLALAFGGGPANLVFRGLIQAQVLFYQVAKTGLNKRQRFSEEIATANQQAAGSRLTQSIKELAEDLTLMKVVFIGLIAVTGVQMNGSSLSFSGVSFLFALIIYGYRVSAKKTEV